MWPYKWILHQVYTEQNKYTDPRVQSEKGIITYSMKDCTFLTTYFISIENVVYIEIKWIILINIVMYTEVRSNTLSYTQLYNQST